MDKKKPLPTFIEIISLIRPAGRKPRSAKAPEKRVKMETEGKEVPASSGSVKAK
jgi:hypothetical protein